MVLNKHIDWHLYSEQLDTVNMIMIVMDAFKIYSDLPTRVVVKDNFTYSKICLFHKKNVPVNV